MEQIKDMEEDFKKANGPSFCEEEFTMAMFPTDHPLGSLPWICHLRGNGAFPHLVQNNSGMAFRQGHYRPPGRRKHEYILLCTEGSNDVSL